MKVSSRILVKILEKINKCDVKSPNLRFKLYRQVKFYPNADLDFYWEILWNNEGSWSYIGNSEMFTFNNLQEGNHTVKLSITYEGDSANETQQMIVLPPIPQMIIDYNDGGSIKEGETLEINAQCFDNNQNEVECEYYWEIYDNDGNPDVNHTDTDHRT